MRKFDYVLFDLDGTLTDSGEGVMNSVKYGLKKFGIEEENTEKLRSFIGPPLVDSFTQSYGMTKKEAVKTVDYYREYYNEKGIYENRLYEGIKDLLSSLKSAGIKVILATSKPEYYAVKILKYFDIYNYFDCVVGADMDENKSSKKADIIRNALKRANIEKTDRAVMVGDRSYDILGGKQNGIHTVGVLFGYGERDELQNANADYIAETVDELKNILI